MEGEVEKVLLYIPQRLHRSLYTCPSILQQLIQLFLLFHIMNQKYASSVVYFFLKSAHDLCQLLIVPCNRILKQLCHRSYDLLQLFVRFIHVFVKF